MDFQKEKNSAQIMKQTSSLINFNPNKNLMLLLHKVAHPNPSNSKLIELVVLKTETEVFTG